MGGVGKAINKASNSTIGKVVAPVFTLPAMAIQKVTGLSPASQLGIGAGVGAGAMALGSMGALGGANAMFGGGAAAAGGAGTAGVGGLTSAALGPGGAGVMAQSGGVPLLTKVLLGASVGSTLASYFGRKSPEDYRSWFDGLNAEDQQQIKGLEDNLTHMQNDLDLRNQAVQKVVDDYPNVVSQVAQQRQAAGTEFDSTTKAMMDQVSNQLSAKYAASGGFSSGAFNQGLAQEAGTLAQQKLGYMNDREASAYQQQMAGYNTRLSEVEALRNFQQQMLGVGTQQRFSAAQAQLNRQNDQTLGMTQMNNQNRIADNQSTNQLFGSIGQTLGTAAMLPMYQQMYSANRYGVTQPTQAMSSPRLTMPNYDGGGQA